MLDQHIDHVFCGRVLRAVLQAQGNMAPMAGDVRLKLLEVVDVGQDQAERLPALEASEERDGDGDEKRLKEPDLIFGDSALR
jgi:hypothetical protein